MSPTPNPTPNPNSGELHKNMGAMETSISDLQGELVVANEPSKNHFKPGWLITALIVMMLVGSATYLTVRQFTRVDANSKAISLKCQLGNEQVILINEKLNQLNLLISAALRNSVGEPDPEVLQAFEALRKPIPLKACD